MAQTLGGATSTGDQRKSSPLRTRQGESLAITARVSIVRWNLKEAGGKALARRTGIVYKAAALDERANRLKVQYLYGKRGSRHGGHKREGVSALPVEISRLVQLIGTTIVERRREEP